MCAFIQTFLLPSHPNFNLIILCSKIFSFYFPFSLSPFSLNILFFFEGIKKILTENEDVEESPNVGFCEQVAIAANSIAEFIYKNSYIFTNVVMMVNK